MIKKLINQRLLDNFDDNSYTLEMMGIIRDKDNDRHRDRDTDR